MRFSGILNGLYADFLSCVFLQLHHQAPIILSIYACSHFQKHFMPVAINGVTVAMYALFIILRYLFRCNCAMQFCCRIFWWIMLKTTRQNLSHPTIIYLMMMRWCCMCAYAGLQTCEEGQLWVANRLSKNWNRNILSWVFCVLFRTLSV